MGKAIEVDWKDYVRVQETDTLALYIDKYYGKGGDYNEYLDFEKMNKTKDKK